MTKPKKAVRRKRRPAVKRKPVKRKAVRRKAVRRRKPAPAKRVHSRNRKHNWHKLEIAYYTGDEADLTAFLKSQTPPIKRNGHTNQKTKSWVKIRQELGQRAVGVAKERVEQELVDVDIAARRDAMKMYRSLFGLLGRAFIKRGMTSTQAMAEAVELDKIMQRVVDGELSYQKAKAEMVQKKLELPADIDMFAFESILRSTRLTLGMPTQITKSDLTHNLGSIADLVDELGDDLEDADRERKAKKS